MYTQSTGLQSLLAVGRRGLSRPLAVGEAAGVSGTPVHRAVATCREALSHLYEGLQRGIENRARAGIEQLRYGSVDVTRSPIGAVEPLGDKTFKGGVATGRYLLVSDPLARGDPLTRLVTRSKFDRSFDPLIADRLAATHVAAGLPRPDIVVSPPAGPGKVDRLVGIRRLVAARLGATAHGSPFREVADIPNYRQMTVAERMWATTALGINRFAVTDARGVQGRSVLIIDDVATSGEQARALRRTLLEAGATDVRLVALAHGTDVAYGIRTATT